EDTVVRVQDAVPADFVLLRQDLSLELDPIVPGNIRPHIQRRSFLLVSVTELKDHFRIAHGKTVNVGNAPPQDEGVVVEAEVRRVEENDLPDIWPATGLGV